MDNNDNKKKKSLTQVVGGICGTVFFACLALCAMAITVALTYKFIFWLF